MNKKNAFIAGVRLPQNMVQEMVNSVINAMLVVNILRVARY